MRANVNDEMVIFSLLFSRRINVIKADGKGWFSTKTPILVHKLSSREVIENKIILFVITGCAVQKNFPPSGQKEASMGFSSYIFL